MLILLRSDFRRDSQRSSFISLLGKARVDTKEIAEATALEAPRATSIAIRMRKLEIDPAKKTMLVFGSMTKESVEETIDALEALRLLLPALAMLPCIILARKFEWESYGQVAKAPKDIEFFEMPLLRGRVLVLPQADSYNERQYFAVMAQLIPPSFGASPEGTRGKDRDSTGVMYLDEKPTGSMKRLTDSMLEGAGIKAEESAPGVERGDPTEEIPINSEDRITEMPPPPDAKKT